MSLVDAALPPKVLYGDLSRSDLIQANMGQIVVVVAAATSMYRNSPAFPGRERGAIGGMLASDGTGSNYRRLGEVSPKSFSHLAPTTSTQHQTSVVHFHYRLPSRQCVALISNPTHGDIVPDREWIDPDRLSYFRPEASQATTVGMG